jgi:hypothetical protein
VRHVWLVALASTSLRKHAACTGIVAAVLSIAVGPAAAVEEGVSPYPKGFVGFMSGFLPPQSGFYASDIYYFYGGSAGASIRDGSVELGVDATLNAGFLQGTYVTDWHILGGQYAFGAAVGWAGLGLNAAVETQLGGVQASFGNNALADSLVTPVLVGWHDGNLNWNAGLSIYVPTGAYSTQRGSLNIGKNIWAFMPQAGVTYFDPKSGWDVSGTFVYVTQTNNDATDYQSGDIFHLDWAVGKHFGDRMEWEAGIAGNVVAQVTGDSGAGAKLGSFKETSSGIGPAVNYSTKLEGIPLTLGAKWEHDFAATNTFKGDVVTVSASVAF